MFFVSTLIFRLIKTFIGNIMRDYFEFIHKFVSLEKIC